MTEVHGVSIDAPNEVFSAGPSAPRVSDVLDEFWKLWRRSMFSGLLPAATYVERTREQAELHLLRQVGLISDNMEHRGMPANSSVRHLFLNPAWQEFVASPDGLPQEGWELVSDVAGSLRAALHQMNDQIEMSPQPAGEWAPAIETLGEDLLASLISTSGSSIRRYSTGARQTPQDVAERLHFVALVLADLAGSYNEFGIRRWFSRPRSALGGRSPGDLLGVFDIDSDEARTVARLAGSLTGAGAA